MKNSVLSKKYMASLISALSKINYKTLLVNFKYLPFTDAIKLPIFISRKVYLMDLKGSITIKGEIASGMIRIGYGEIGIFDRKNSRSILELRGKLVFENRAKFGQACKISVGERATLTIGDNLLVTAESSIACHKKITIGHDCLISWEVQIMDTDFHKIKDKAGRITNPDKEIKIGDRVWIGSRCTILKGSEIPEGCVIATNSLTNKKFKVSSSIIGGNPAKEIASDIEWEA